MSSMFVDNLYVHADDLEGVVGYFHGTAVTGVEAEPAPISQPVPVYPREVMYNPVPSAYKAQRFEGEQITIPTIHSLSQGLWIKHYQRELKDQSRYKNGAEPTPVVYPDIVCGDFIVRTITAYEAMRKERPSIRCAAGEAMIAGGQQ